MRPHNHHAFREWAAAQTEPDPSSPICAPMTGGALLATARSRGSGNSLPGKASLTRLSHQRTHRQRTGLFLSIQSSRHSGNSVDCPRSAPQWTASSIASANRAETPIRPVVFHHPGSGRSGMAPGGFANYLILTDLLQRRRLQRRARAGIATATDQSTCLSVIYSDPCSRGHARSTFDGAQPSALDP
jgi:hypothetical protein